MIRKAITELKERGGSSRQAILKYLQTHYNLGTNMPQVGESLVIFGKKIILSVIEKDPLNKIRFLCKKCLILDQVALPSLSEAWSHQG